MSVKKLSKGLTPQTTSALKQPWKGESKKVEVAVIKELKKAAKGRKRERSVIPLPFPVLAKKLYNILEA